MRINSQLGNIGTTVLVTDPIEVAPVNQLASLQELVADMNAGAVKALVILGGNPVFDAPADLQLREALDKVPFRAHLSPYYDETSMRCHWHIPETHLPRVVGRRARARRHRSRSSSRSSRRSTTAAPRTKSSARCSAASIRRRTTPCATTGCSKRRDIEDTWRKWLHDGVIAGTALRAASPPRLDSHPDSQSTSNQQPASRSSSRPDPTIYDGRFANNGWLQELPKPQTKITWDNVMLVGPKTADEDRLRRRDARSARQRKADALRRRQVPRRYHARCRSGSCPDTPRTWRRSTSATAAATAGRSARVPGIQHLSAPLLECVAWRSGRGDQDLRRCRRASTPWLARRSTSRSIRKTSASAASSARDVRRVPARSELRARKSTRQ